jgi:polyisoprenoid-binding protein YceI
MNFRRWAFALILMPVTALIATPAGAKLIKFTIDRKASHIIATVDEPLARMQGSVAGSFEIITGEIDGDPADPVGTGHIDIVINATTYSSGNTHRDNVVLHDALETRFYPIIKFVSTRIENLKWDQQGVSGTATIVGNLRLHGIIKEIKVPVNGFYANDGSFSVDGDYQFDCTEFGIRPPRGLFGTLQAGKMVDLNFRIAANPDDTPAPTPTPP